MADTDNIQTSEQRPIGRKLTSQEEAQSRARMHLAISRLREDMQSVFTHIDEFDEEYKFLGGSHGNVLTRILHDLGITHNTPNKLRSQAQMLEKLLTDAENRQHTIEDKERKQRSHSQNTD